MRMDVKKLARVLRWLVLAVLILNLICLPMVPGLVALVLDGGPGMIRKAFYHHFVNDGLGFRSLPMFFLTVLGAFWKDGALALWSVFFWLWGICTAGMLWQAKRILETILKGEPFQMSNAKAMKRAAVFCWTISGTALVRLILWLWSSGDLMPLFTYTALFIPVFFMAGLLFLVMSALFRQAAELKEDQDLTI